MAVAFRYMAFILMGTALLGLSACAERPADEDAALQSFHQEGLLGTVITISLYGGQTMEALAVECFEAIADIDARMSANRPDSELAALSLNSGKAPVTLTADTYGLIARSLQLAERTEGACDSSIGVISDLWKVDGVFSRLPPESEIAARLPLVGWRNIALMGGNQVFLSEPGMMLDLGSMAKGYASDKILEMIQEKNVPAALLDLGGNVYAYGQKPDGSDWRVGIRAPFQAGNDLACVLTLSDKAVVTSGGYERFFEQDGRTYHHLLDPKTGYPADSGLLSVTIIADSAEAADGLSTACFVSGLEAGLELLRRTPGYEGIFITEEHLIYCTAGIKAQVSEVHSAFRIV